MENRDRSSAKRDSLGRAEVLLIFRRRLDVLFHRREFLRRRFVAQRRQLGALMLDHLLLPLFARHFGLFEVLLVVAFGAAALAEMGATRRAQREKKDQAKRSHGRLL